MIENLNDDNQILVNHKVLRNPINESYILDILGNHIHMSDLPYIINIVPSLFFFIV